MNRRIGVLVVLASVGLLGGSMAVATEQGNPPMHMHKSDMSHDKKDAEVATEYKSEAMRLRDKAESHRKLAQLYKKRTPPKGSGSYANVARHCDNLAKFYEDAAREAEAVASELGKP